MSVKGVIAKFVSAASKVKADVLKAASEADGIAVKLRADAPEIEAVADAALPGASTYVNIGVSLFEGAVDILDAGGSAAEQNLKNAGFDEALIAQVKAQIANVKKLV